MYSFKKFSVQKSYLYFQFSPFLLRVFFHALFKLAFIWVDAGPTWLGCHQSEVMCSVEPDWLLGEHPMVVPYKGSDYKKCSTNSNLRLDPH